MDSDVHTAVGPDDGHDECERQELLRANGIEKAMVDHQEPCGLAVYGQRFPSKWLTLVEYVDEDGDRQLAAHHSPGLQPWEAAGMMAVVSDAVL